MSPLRAVLADERVVIELTDAERALLLPLWATQTVAEHSPRVGPGGESCDELGCSICNAGDGEWVEWVTTAWRQRPDDPSDPWWDFPWPTDAEIVEAARDYLAELSS